MGKSKVTSDYGAIRPALGRWISNNSVWVDRISVSKSEPKKSTSHTKESPKFKDDVDVNKMRQNHNNKEKDKKREMAQKILDNPEALRKAKKAVAKYRKNKMK